MAFLLENAFNGSALVQDANNHPSLRMMTTKKTTAATPLRDLEGPLPLPWAVSSNISVSDDGKVLSTLRLHAPIFVTKFTACLPEMKPSPRPIPSTNPDP